MINTQAFVSEVLNQLQLKKPTYADVRIIKNKSKSIATKDGIVEAYGIGTSFGFNVRILVNSGWGFAASPLENNFSLNKKNKDLIIKTVNQAFNLAKAASSLNKNKLNFPALKPVKASFKTKYKKDPFQVNDNQIISLLLKADKNLRSDKKVKISQAFFSCYQTEKILASTEGSYINQEILYTGGGIEATAIEAKEVQNRTYPNSFRGQFATKGFELIEELDLVNHAPEIGRQAAGLISAPKCPTGEYDIIIDGNQLALQVHESCGHAVEFDRMIGLEASFAGTSFIKPTDIGSLEYGSKIVNITADATLAGGLGSFGFDDEGVASKRQEIVKNGILVGVLTNRETAAKYNLPISAAMRAESWQYLPIIRMTNINLEPGTWDLDKLISDTKNGLFLSTNRSWSIDDQRINFQFGTEIAWEIKNGKLGKIYKNPIYSGTTKKFWHSCDAICDQNHWQIWGTPNCGKGEPVQTMHVAHGTAPARFRKVKVFSG